MQGVKEKALELLASGKAQRVLGWKTGEFFYDLTPGVFESAEEVEREFEYGVFAGANLSKYCIAESKKDGVTAVCCQYFYGLARWRGRWRWWQSPAEGQSPCV